MPAMTRRVLTGRALLNIALAIGLVGLMRASLAGQIPLIERLLTRWVPPKSPAEAVAVSEPEREALAALARHVKGLLVWSSNREGNHELYLAGLGTGTVQRLTNHPHVDYFSRFSPDGVRISFLRSQRPWVSFREESAWDLYVMNRDGTGERRVAVGAHHATWTPDGSALIFKRDNRVVRVDIETGREQVLHDGAAPPTDGSIGDPALQQDGLLALTVRRGTQRVGVLDLNRGTYEASSSPRACHIAWMPGGRALLWVSGVGRGGSRIMHRVLGEDQEHVLIDLPGDYSHEYFPQVSPDGVWLVWGAAAQGHEHDRADYEIFIWKIGSPWESAQRITHHAANDQWPDLLVQR
jgi:Tol biopolymer transport system component